MAATDDTRALTYAELARARGISPASAKRLALRHGWHKEPGNDGLARVRVPATWLETPPATENNRHPGDTSPATVPVATLARLQQDMEATIRAAEGERDAAQGEADRLRERAAHAEGERDGLREALRRADAAVETAHRRVEEAGERLRESAERLERAQTAAQEAAARLAQLRAEADGQRQAREAAEAERDLARGESATSREQVTAERERAEAAEGELAAWTSGGPLRRAWRGFLGRRGQP